MVPDGNYFPKYFHIAAYGDYAYASLRYDGFEILQIGDASTGSVIERVDVIVEEREFSEGLAIEGDLLWVAHHVDGLEVFDLSTDPAAPASLARLSEGLVDVWNVTPGGDGTIWIADGAGGVKRGRYDDGTIVLDGGDTLATSPGMVHDETVVGDWVLATASGQGVVAYDPETVVQAGSLSLPGVCVDLSPMSGNRAAVACRSRMHVIEVTTEGEVELLASARLHRRLDGTDLSTHIGSGVTVDGDVLYVAGWDHLDAYELVADAVDGQPDIQVSGQRVHFGSSVGETTFEVRNAGSTPLDISGVEVRPSTPAVSCTLEPADPIDTGESAILSVSFDGSTEDVSVLCVITSDDPDVPELGIQVFAALTGIVDPGEEAPPFSGTVLEMFYERDELDSRSLDLEGFASRDLAAHFAIFGSW